MITERAAGRVLVVDADESSRRRQELRLMETGFVVITCDSSASCLELAESAGPEVILIDVDLPGIGAVETCRRVKSRRETSDIPVVFMSASDRDESTTLEVLEAGASDFVQKFGSKPLLRVRLQSRVEGYRAHVRLRRVSMTDDLTGLTSRASFMETLRREVSSASRRLEGLSLVQVDVDHFRKFNDQYGHTEGDRILQQVADILRQSVRDSDLVGRIGSDEFAVLLSAGTPDGAKAAAEKIRAAVETELRSTTVSVGVSNLPPPETDTKDGAAIDARFERIKSSAEGAMREAKRDRNKVSVRTA